ncbi:MAG: hypothetical protein ABH877_02345, partial [bacterium]
MAAGSVDMMIKHLYVHIPFCRSRCDYCDFASEPVRLHAQAGRVDRYVGALRAELADHFGYSLRAQPPETIYMGGGTPTALPAELLVSLARDLAALQGGASEDTPVDGAPTAGAAASPAPGAA